MLTSLDQNVTSLRDAFDRLGQVAASVAHESTQGGLDDGRNAVELMRVRAQVHANVVAVRTADQTIGSLLDTFA